MLDSETLAITRSLANGVKTYDQVLEVSCLLLTQDILDLSFIISASCFLATWRGLALSRVFPLSSERGH